MNKILHLLCLACLVASCGGVSNSGPVVGGPCSSDADCDERCERHDDFPEGVCTLRCSSDDDCPGESRCIDKEGGICLLACERPGDCRGGYTCKGERNLGLGGESTVCIGG